jgi:hypothetical protein
MGKHRKQRETTDAEMFAWASRLIEHCITRASTNPVAWAMLPALATQVETGWNLAATALYQDAGISLGKLAEIATGAGRAMSRQAAQQRWSPTGQAYRAARDAKRREIAAHATVAARWRDQQTTATTNVAQVLPGHRSWFKTPADTTTPAAEAV